MKHNRFSEERIISILKEYEAGARMADLSRKHGVSEQSLYRWRSKYEGMSVSEAKRLRQLERENAKLKHLLKEARLDKKALKELLSKDW